MANTLLIQNPQYYTTYLPGATPIMRGGPEETYIKETASQTYTIEDLIYFDSNGTIAICTNAGGAGNQLDSAIAGLATAKASGVTGAQVKFHAIRGDEIFVMNVWHATAASAVTAQTQLGQVFALRLDSAALPTGTGGKWVVDIQNTGAIEDATHSLARVKVVGFYQGRVFTNDTPSKEVDATLASDIYGKVLVKFLPFSIASDGSPFIRILQLDPSS